ncbi:MAG: DUF5666 domain-containing protein, partial [Desulfobacterales bacterium]
TRITEMKAYHLKSILLVLMSSDLLVSCSGSGGPFFASGGIDGSGIISQGSISGFGSIFVNGTEFDTSDAAIIINGVEIGIGDDVVRQNLDIGRVITAEGQRFEDPNTAVADRLTYSNNVKGPVESILEIDDVTKEIIVLGQTVIVNTATNFKDATFDTIAENDVVEVSGLFDDTGAIYATFIGKTVGGVPGLEVEVTGYAVNLDPVLKSFEINGLTVDYSSADTSGLPGGLPAEGLFVEVQGTIDAIGGEMVASKIQPGDELDAVDAAEIEVTGFVTDFFSSSEFTVGNQPVQTGEDTLFVDGTQADVALGVKLEAEGTLVDGILLATEIEFWDPGQIEVEGFVTSIDSPSEFTIGSQRVQTDVTTVFEGGTPEDIVLGVKIEVKGVPADTNQGVLFADKVSFERQ